MQPLMDVTHTPIFSNRQMGAQLRKLGFQKSSLQMTRMGMSYCHPDHPRILLTFGKTSEFAPVMITDTRPPGDRPVDLGLIGAFLDENQIAFFKRIGVELPYTENGEPRSFTQRELLLCIARFIADGGHE
jgi:hypothetical protein